MTRRSAPLILAVVLVLGGCRHSAPERETSPAVTGGTTTTTTSQRSAESGPVSVVEGRVTSPYAVAARVRGLPGQRGAERLAAPVNAALFGTLSPAVVFDGAGGALAYNAFERSEPVIRVRDVETDRERVLARRAYSVALGRDGRFAYFHAPSLDAEDLDTFVGHVVVATGSGDDRVRWTAEADRYVVAAWAGERLLVYRLRPPALPDLLLFDGPKKERRLAAGSALVAVSPDGTRAFVTEYGAAPPRVRVLDLANGSAGAELTVEPDGNWTPVALVGEAGSWVGDLVAASTDSGVVVFRVESNRIAPEQQLLLDPELFPTGVLEPQMDAEARRIVMVAEIAAAPRQAIAPAGILECDRFELECVVGTRAPSIPGPRVVYNPSRP